MRKKILRKASILIPVIGLFLMPMNLKAHIEDQKNKKKKVLEVYP